MEAAFCARNEHISILRLVEKEKALAEQQQAD